LTTASNAGSSALSFVDWMKTISPCSSSFVGKPASTIRSAVLASPTLLSPSSKNVVFTMPLALSAKAMKTNASQPKVAVFQWLALHRPMRAAMLVERLRGDNLESP
jgi:hypothetical protein